MKNKQFLIALVAAITLITACKKDAEFDSSPARLFRPPTNMLTADSNTITATWFLIKDISSYTIQISKDSFATILKSANVLDTGFYVFKNLEFNRLYQLRVRANAPDTLYNSKWAEGAIKTEPSILKIPTSDDITHQAVRASWTTKGAPVTSIKILKADSSVVTTVNLLPADITSQLKIITGLTPSTKYIIVLYSGTDIRGYADFSTTVKLEGIDLTAISGRPSVLSDTIPIIPAGSTVILKRGETYTIGSSISFNKSINFVSGPDLSTNLQAIISMPSNFNITAGSVIDFITFKDVTLRGTDYASKYVFNINTAFTITQMSFSNCTAEIFRGIVRLQNGTITNFLLENSVVDSVRDYGVINADAATAKVENIIIRKSTIYKAEKIVVSKSNATSVLIDECTINEAPLGNSNAYVAYATFVVTNGITINNCIFGVGKYAATGGTSTRGVIAGAATSINGSNNYRTSDQVSAGNEVPNVTPSTKTVAQLFVNAAVGNYKIADNTFPGKNSTGDPRWRL